MNFSTLNFHRFRPFVLGGLAFLLALPLRAQTNALPTGDRYLFVVETSDNMKRRSER